ncbi:hypothetical protein P7K49_006103 [Saguinus oedipus]|uniref:Uncharacterized protein n=1 Tax=Saguinus oedipus TaxID=9490 RepID=A0ABQ9W523_SAGOE|nr:hypothetical protein P7K49_006103 [Saguinus oedipus]
MVVAKALQQVEAMTGGVPGCLVDGKSQPPNLPYEIHSATPIDEILNMFKVERVHYSSTWCKGMVVLLKKPGNYSEYRNSHISKRRGKNTSGTSGVEMIKSAALKCQAPSSSSTMHGAESCMRLAPNRLLTKDPECRLSSLRDLQSVPYLADMNWDAVFEKALMPGFVPNSSPVPASYYLNGGGDPSEEGKRDLGPRGWFLGSLRCPRLVFMSDYFKDFVRKSALGESKDLTVTILCPPSTCTHQHCTAQELNPWEENNPGASCQGAADNNGEPPLLSSVCVPLADFQTHILDSPEKCTRLLYRL